MCEFSCGGVVAGAVESLIPEGMSYRRQKPWLTKSATFSLLVGIAPLRASR